jgi:GDP-4-dehydro-6-deoxy-D-mannose reductase
MVKIIITGASGFIGSHLCDFCINKNLEVYAIIRPERSLINLNQYTKGKNQFSKGEKIDFIEEKIQIPSDNEKITILECDVKNKELLEKIIHEITPKYIFHLGAQSNVIPSWEDPIETIESNVIGTINVFEPIKQYKLKTRVITACSSAEYGTTTEINRPLKESDPLMAVHPYGISKIATELLARQYFLNFGIDIINLRFFNQTGPRKVGDACADFVNKVAEIELGLIEPVIEVGNLNPFRDITGIKDTLNAIWLTATKGRSGETYQVCSNIKTQVREILDIVLSFSNKNIEVIEKTPHKMRSTDENIILGDNSKIKNEVGFKITQSVEQVLKDMFTYWIDYYKKNKA